MQHAIEYLHASVANLSTDLGRLFGHSDATPQDAQLCNQIWPAFQEIYPLHCNQYTQLAIFVKEQTARLRTLHSQIPEEKITDTLKCLYIQCGKSREDVMEVLGRTLNLDGQASDDQGLLMRTLEIAASLYLMLDVYGGENLGVPNSTAVLWKPDTSMNDIFKTHFTPETDNITNCLEGVIDEKLTVRNLVVNYGFEIDWVNNLNDHLRFDSRTKVLSIYQHKIWLLANVNPKILCAIPCRAIGECLDTLNLLFPHYEPSTGPFLKDRGRNFNLLGNYGRKVPRDLKNYPRWGKQIFELLKILKGPQVGFRQLLPRPDHSNLIDSVNFWIAVLVATLTVISFVFGLVAVIYAKLAYEASEKSLTLTELQYRLSLVQACSDPGASTDMLLFCQQ
jgi:hypothetical protein